MQNSAPPSGKTDDADETVGGSAWERRVRRLHKTATLETLEALGFDVDDINAIQADLLFLRKLRSTSESTNAKITAGVIGLVFTVAGALLTLAMQSFFK